MTPRVMTSLYEGMPNALMEAMCLGIPVVCSDCPCGGPKELLRNGINGFLFKNGSIGDLKEKIRDALKADPKKIAMAEKKICNTHSVDAIFRRWCEIFENGGIRG